MSQREPRNTIPYWTETASLTRFPRLDHDLHVDVLVVGGGITGLTAGYLLARAGRSVAVLERGRCGSMDSGHTSAHLSAITDATLTDLETRFGRDHARAVWDAGYAAIAQIDTIVRDEQIACEFAWVPGYLYSADDRPSPDEAAALQREASLAMALGFDAEFLTDVPFVHRPGIRFDHQAKFHPRKYFAGLAHAIIAHGGQLFEHSAVEEFSDHPVRAKVNGCTITAGYVILATHSPLPGNTPEACADLFQTKLALYSTYMVAGRVHSGTVPEALFWSTATPYTYLRSDRHRDHDVVMYGGEDHKTGQVTDTSACYMRLEHGLRSLVPGVELSHRWSGQVIETTDGLPFLGETADRQFAATGFSGNGMTFGTLGALIACDRIMHRSNPWQELFAPDRTVLPGHVWDYLLQNKDYPYYLLRDQFAGAATRSLRTIGRGRGALVDVGGKRVAAFRDESGATTLRSAECTHKGCLVAWNDAERTWDCPCHGSRFKANGDVLSGPAESPLAPVAPPPSAPALQTQHGWIEAGVGLMVLPVTLAIVAMVAPLIWLFGSASALTLASQAPERSSAAAVRPPSKAAPRT